MARRTALAEATDLINRFFTETKDGYMKDVLATRIPERRSVLLSEVDVLDKVEGRYYAWINSQRAAK